MLRVMRAQGLLSPHRGRQGDPKAHDGTIVTSAPQVMWGTDGVRVFTVEDGWVWTFAAVDHWNAECVGWHVCKVGSRFAALEPIAQGSGDATARSRRAGGIAKRTKLDVLEEQVVRSVIDDPRDTKMPPRSFEQESFLRDGGRVPLVDPQHPLAAHPDVEIRQTAGQAASPVRPPTRFGT